MATNHTPSPEQLRWVGFLNMLLLAAAALTFWSGIRLHVFHDAGMRELAHAILPTHLWCALSFIVLGVIHVRVNCWWFRRLFSGHASPRRFSTYFLPLYLAAFLFMAVTGLLKWWFHIHGSLVPMHVVVGFVFLGMAGLHVLMHFSSLIRNPEGKM